VSQRFREIPPFHALPAIAVRPATPSSNLKDGNAAGSVGAEFTGLAWLPDMRPRPNLPDVHPIRTASFANHKIYLF